MGLAAPKSAANFADLQPQIGHNIGFQAPVIESGMGTQESTAHGQHGGGAGAENAREMVQK